MKNGDRIFDAIDKAGGFIESADKTALNLARKIKDGEHIMIPKIGDRLTDKKININTADVEELSTLRGIGKSKAEAIIKYRKNHGNFNNIDELKNIRGLKESVFENIKDLITVE